MLFTMCPVALRTYVFQSDLLASLPGCLLGIFFVLGIAGLLVSSVYGGPPKEAHEPTPNTTLQTQSHKSAGNDAMLHAVCSDGLVTISLPAGQFLYCSRTSRLWESKNYSSRSSAWEPRSQVQSFAAILFLFPRLTLLR